MNKCTCDQCIFIDLCSRWEQSLNNSDNLCNNFVDTDNYIDDLEEDEDGYIWAEMSWNKFCDNLFNYIEDNTP